MFRSRTLRVRGKPVELQQSEDIVAVKRAAEAAATPAVGRQRAAGRARKKLRVTGRSAIQDLPSDLSADEVQAFENAGWTFLASHRAQDFGPEVVARVFVKPGGRIALGTHRLTVKLKQTQDDSQVVQLLAKFGLRVIQQLRFAPNLYQVTMEATEPGKDALDVANELVDAGVVDFAEPEFVEVIGPRSDPPRSG